MMKKTFWIFSVAVVLALVFATTASAELSNVKVGGDIKMRPQFTLSPGGDDNANNLSFAEQRARINVEAEFTDNVSAFIELQWYGIWGTEFRPTVGGNDNYLYGADFNGNYGDVDLYQAYIAIKDIFGAPIDLYLGRKELVYGSEWLVGNNDTNSLFGGLSFDGVVADYKGDTFNVSLWASKLVELRNVESDNDTDFMGIYGSFNASDALCADLYWMYIRNADDPFSVLQDIDELHTIGARVYGKADMIDYSVEAAFQFGDAADRAGGLNEGDYEGWGLDAGIGVTLETEVSPRFGLMFVYLSGDDDYTDNDVETFNRLFSDKEYGEILDNGACSNIMLFGATASAQLTEKVSTTLVGCYAMVAEDDPKPFGNTDDDLGVEVDLYLNYQYSEDLMLKLGYSHLFAGDGLEENLVAAHGYAVPGVDDDDVDYLFAELQLTF